MKKKLKFLVLLSSLVIVYFIYMLNNNNNVNYLVLGDSLSLGENSYGAVSYGYGDFLKDYLKDNNKLLYYSKDYASKDKTIKDIYNDILLNKEIIIDGKHYNIKSLLREADIITMSIGLNDIIFEYNLNDNLYNENIIVEKIFNNYKNLITEIKKYYHNKIYIIGYYKRWGKYNKLIDELNNKYKNYAIKNNDIFISTNFVEKNNNYFDNPNTYYPNIKAYKKISTKIVEKIN